MLLVLIFGLSSVSASDNSADSVQATDETDDVVVSTSEVEKVSSTDTDIISEANTNKTLISASEDSGEELGATTGTFTELQSIIDGSSSGSTITLDKDYKYDESFGTNTGINVNKAITIEGNGHMLDGACASRIMTINANVIINNLTFINANYTYGGGAIFVNLNNYNLEVRNSIFKNNIIQNNVGSSILADATASQDTKCSLIIDKCQFLDSNLARCTIYTRGRTNITNSYFSNVTGASQASAIRFQGTLGYVINSTFENIACTDGGSIVHGNYGKYTLINCNFSNITTNSNIVNVNPYTSTASLNVINCSFKDNNVVMGSIFIYSGCQLNVTDSSFINNSALKGGAIYLQNDVSANIVNSEFINNSATKNGGAIYSYPDNELNVKNNYFNGNTANLGGNDIFSGEPTNQDVIYISPIGLGDGTGLDDLANWEYALYNSKEGATIYFTNGTYSFRTTISKTLHLVGLNDTDVYAYAATGFTINSTNTSVKHFNFRGYDGRYLFEWLGDNGTISDCNFTTSSNVAHIIWSGKNGNINNCNFTKNRAGCIIWYGENGIVSNSYFESNCRSNEGSSVTAYAGASNFKLINSTFINNYLTKSGYQYGGAVFLYNFVGAQISGCEFINNKATRGGAIETRVKDTTITNSIFINNVGTDGDGGGAIFTDVSDTIINYNAFINTSSHYDNGVYSYRYVPDVNLNWWGTNDGPLDSYFKGVKPTITSYLKLNLTVLSNEIVINEYTPTVLTNFVAYDKTNNKVSSIDNDIDVAVRPVTYSANKGIILNGITGQGSGIKLDESSGRHSVAITSKVDNQQLTKTFNLNIIPASFKALQLLVDLTPENDILDLNNDYNFDEAIDSEYTKGIKINKSITINGNGHIIDAQKKGRIFYIDNGPNVIMNNLKLTNSYLDGLEKDGEGGLIFLDSGSKLHIYDCEFYNANVSSEGNIFTNHNTKLYIYNSYFHDNYAGRTGAAIYSRGNTYIVNSTFAKHLVNRTWATIRMQNGYLFMDNCTIKDNCGINGSGGIFSNLANITLNRVIFINNTGYAGAAITLLEYSPDVPINFNITNCQFINNTGNMSGAIYTRCTGDLSISNTIFSGNVALNESGENDILINGTNRITRNSLTFYSKLNIKAESVMYGSDVLIEGNLSSSDSNVTLTLYQNRVRLTDVNVVNNKFTFTWKKPVAGNYTLTLATRDSVGNTYVYDYTPVSFEVKKHSSNLILTVDEYKVHQDVIISVDMGNSDASGTVDIFFKGKTTKITLNGGKAELNVGKLPADKYEVTATYSGDGKYLKTEKGTSFNVTKYSTETTLEISNVYVGNAVPVTATVTSDAPFAVNGEIIIAGTRGEYSIQITNGHGSTTVANLPAGRYTVTGVFQENENFTKSQWSTGDEDVNKVAVMKYPTQVTLTAPAVYVDKNAILHVSVAAPLNSIYPVNGTVTIQGSSSTYPVTILNGEGSYDLGKLAAGQYKFTATFAENDYFLNNASETVTLNVNRYDTTLKLDVDNTPVDKDVIINATVTSEGCPLPVNGIVNVNYNSKQYAITITNGKGSTKLSDVPKGSYSLVSEFVQNANFSSSTSNAVFDVTKLDPTVTLSVPDVFSGSKTVIEVTVTGVDKFPVNGKVIVQGNKTSYEVTITNGHGTYTIDTPFEAGRYVFTGTFQGENDNNYNTASSDGVTHNVKLYETQVKITPHNAMVRDGVLLEFEVTSEGPYPINGEISVVGLKTTYPVTITNGKGNITLHGLSANTYPFTAIFADNAYYAKSNASSSVSVSKYATSLVLEMPSVLVGDTATLTVTVLSDLAKANGTVIVTGPTGGDQEVTITNGVGTFEIPNAAAGNYPVTAWFVENDDYLQSSTSTATGVVSKYNITSIVLSAEPVLYGENLVIEAVVTGNGPYPVNGQVRVTGNKDNYTIDITNGIGSVSIPNLEARDYTISGTFLENNYYNKNTSNAVVTVLKHTPTISLEIDPVMIGQDVFIKAHVTGNASHPVNGKAHVTGSQGTLELDIVNGEGNISVKNVAANTYTISGCFEENSVYNSADCEGTVVVNRYQTQTQIVVQNVYVTNDIFIDVTVTSEGSPYPVNGTLTLTGDVSDTITILNGKGNKTVKDLTAGKYEVTGTFARNDYFTNSVSDTVTFYVNKYPTTLKLDVENTPVDKEVVINATVTTIDECLLPVNGVVNVNYNSKQYAITITNGKGSTTLPKMTQGPYSLVSVFVANDYFNSTRANAVFNVTKLTPTVTLTVPDVYSGTQTVINVDVVGVDDFPVNGKVIVQGNKTSYEVQITNGHGTYTIESPFAAGKYLFTGTFQGENDANYNTASSDGVTHNVKLYETQVKITPHNAMVRGDVLLEFEVTSNGPYPINGNIAVIGKGTYNVPIENGIGSISIPGLSEGSYPFTAIFNDNEYYAKSNATSSVTVGKYSTVVTLSMPPALVGQTAVLYVTVTSDLENANGTVTVTGPKGTNEVTITNGVGTFEIPDAAAGSYPVQAWFVENDDYLQSPTASATGIVSKYNITSIVLSAEPVLYGQDVILAAEVIGNGHFPVNGKVRVIGNKNNYTIDIVNGKGNISISGLEARSYSVTGTFIENDYYNKNTSDGEIIVLKHDSDLTLTIDPVMIGQDVLIKAHVAGNESYPVNGVVHVTGSKGVFNITIENGEGSIVIKDVLAGSHTISALFDETAIYKQAEASGLVVVNRYATELSLSADTILVGEDLVIEATVTSELGNVNGTVTINGNLKNYTITITNGKGSLTLSDLPASDYYITGVFAQNAQYLKSNATVHIDVDKHADIVIVTADPILVGDDLTINVEVKGDNTRNATGFVDVTINHKTYPVELINGKGSVVIGDLTAELPTTPYVIGAIYRGDEYYLRNDTEISTTVSKHSSTTTVIINKTTSGEGEDLDIKVGDTVRINVIVDGNEYDVTPTGKVVLGGGYGEIILENGKGYIDIPNLAAGDYHITLTYQEDANYNKSTAVANFEVFKHLSTPTININNVKVGEDIAVEVVLSDGATGDVVITVNGESKPVTLENNRASETFTAIGKAGKYDVSVVYEGDDYYLKSDAKKSFNVTQYKTSVLIEAPDLTELDHDVTIDVTVSNIDNSAITPAGNVTLIVGGQSKVIDLSSGKAQWTVSGLKVGSKTISANYNGNDMFATSANTLTIAIGQHSGSATADINAEVSDVKVGQDVEIKVHIADDATGEVTFTVNGVPTVKNLTNGNTSLVLENLPARNYVVNIAYDGDENYTGTGKQFEFTVSKWDINMTVDVKNINVLDVANVTVNVIGEDGLLPTGNVSFTIAEVPYTINVVNGKGYKLVPNLAANEYKVEATFITTSRYNEFTNETSFKVNKFTPTVTVEVDENYVLGIANVTVKVTGVNDTVVPTRKVTFSIGNENYEIELNESGEGYKEIEGLAADTYYITPVYIGDSNYVRASAETYAFKVLKHNPTFTLNISDVYVGDEITANVTVVGLDGHTPTGNVSVLINGVLKEHALDNGNIILTFNPIAAEEYRAVITYYGDDIYNKVETSAKFNVNKYAPVVTVDVDSIKVLNDAVVNVSVTGARGVGTGQVQISVTGQSHTPTLDSEGKYSQHLTGLAADHYVVTVIFTGDDNYTKSTVSKAFDVEKYDPTVTVSVDDINVTETAHIVVTVTGEASIAPNATVSIYVNNHTYYVDLVDGVATQDIPNLPSRTYTVIANFLGDDYYEEARGSDSFDVLKYSSDMTATVTSVKVGDDAVFKVSILSKGGINATGEVEIAIAALNMHVFANLTNGTLEYNMSGLPADHYLATIIYRGDDNYALIERTTAFDVTKYAPTIDVTTSSIMVGDELFIKVNVSGDAKGIARGNVTITVDGVDYKVVLGDDGTVTQNITGLKARHYDIAVSYFGDENYLEDTAGSEFWVYKYAPVVSIDVNSTKVGEENKVVVKVTGDAKDGAAGQVHFYVAGQEKVVDVIDGVATWTVPEILYSGSYVVEATFLGDDNYNVSEEHKSFEITKWTPTINITVDDIKVGQEATVIINITGDAVGRSYASGEIQFYLNGEHLANLTNGVYTENIKLDTARSYTIDLTYYGGPYYEKAEAHKTFNVGYWAPVVEVSVDSIKVGETATVKVKVTGGAEEEFAQGNISIYVNNVTYPGLVLTNGEYEFDIPQDLNSSHYFVEVNYYGDNYYTQAPGTGEFDVSYWTPTITVTADPIKVGEDAIINVEVDGNAPNAPTGYVELSLAELPGQTFRVNLTDGRGSGKISGLKATDEGYIVTARFVSGHYYQDGLNTTRVFISKSEAKVTVNVENIDVNEVARINVTVTGNASVKPNAIVKLYINNQTYDVELDENGFGFKEIENLPARKYTPIATFVGDDYYNQASGTSSFDVIKYSSSMNVDVKTIMVGDDVVFSIEVITKGDVKATGEVEISIGNRHEFANLTDGKLTYNFKDLAADHYIATVIYEGDANYNRIENTAAFDVNKFKPAITINASNIMVGDDVSVIVNVSGDAKDVATGNVTIRVNGVDYKVVLGDDGTATQKISGLKARHYDIAVSYFGDGNYLESAQGGEFWVYKYAPVISIDVNSTKVGEENKVVVKVTGDADVATGQVHFYVAGQEEIVDVIDGVATWTVPEILYSGSYVVEATFLGDDNYNASEEHMSFAVSKWTPTINITVDDIKVGQEATVIINITGDAVGRSYASGEIQFYLNGEHLGNLTNGVYTENIKLNTARSYTIDLTYYGGPYYEKETAHKTFNVGLWAPTVEVSVDSIKVGETATVKVKVTGGAEEEFAQGNISIYVNNVTYTGLALENGEYEFDIPQDLNKSHYFVEVNYYGDNYYAHAPGTGEFDVGYWTPTINVTTSPIKVGEDAIINVEVDGNAPHAPTGYVLLSLAGQTFTVNLTDGKGSQKVSGLKASSQGYIITAEYVAGRYYEEILDAHTVLQVTKSAAKVEVSVDDIKVDKAAEIVIKVSGNASESLGSGIVSFTLNGKYYEKELTDGTATIEVADLPVGTYFVDVTYSGDDYYEPATGLNTFDVSKYTTSVTFTATDIKVNDNTTITVTLADETDGIVTINLDNVAYNITVNKGVGTKSIQVTKAGDMYVSGWFIGNDLYEKSADAAYKFVVSKRESQINVTADSIKYTEPAVVSVEVTSGVTGTVTVTVNGRQQNITLVNGKGSATFEGLDIGTYTVYAEYLGDYQYEASENDTVTFTVSSGDAEIEYDIPAEVIIPDDATITVTVKDATGDVTITVGTHTETVTLNNSTATIVVPGLTEGTYTVKVHYAGDDKYKQADSESDSFIVRYLNGKELQELIDQAIANNETEITLDRDYKFTEGDEPVVIDAPITINGNGHTIDANGTSGIFNVTGDDVVIKDITLTGGNATEGGAIIWSGDNGVVDNVTFINNTAENGGAIKWTGDNATIKDSEFVNNTAGEKGGAVLIEGDNATIEDSTFEGNNAQEGAGAVLNGDNAKVENSTFIGNEADTGAGILIGGNNATVEDSTFANNTAMTGAGVVSNGNGTTIGDSEFTGNNANTGAGAVLNGENATVEGSTFTGNEAVNGAGVVSNGNGTTIADTTFENNTAETGAGAVLNGNDASVENSTFAGNNASEGAGLVVNGNGTAVTGSEFVNNTADIGAGVVINGDDASVENSTFAGNEADTGAGIVTNGDNTNITGSTFENNTAMTGAGVVSNGNGTTISDSEFTGNNANTGAGAVLNGENATVEGSTFTGNEAVNGAGVVSNGNGTAIADTTFENNTAETGAGVILNGNDASVENSTFAGNNATTGAGIVSNGNGTEVSGTDFVNNTAVNGAGVILNGNDASVENTTFTGNNATNGGSAIVIGTNATGTEIGNNTYENNTGASVLHTPEMSITVVPSSILYEDESIVTVTVKDATGEVTLVIGDFTQTASLVDGVSTFTVSGIPVGDYTVTADYLGDDYFTGASVMDSLTISYATFADLQELINQAIANNQTEVILNRDYAFGENDTGAITIPEGITINGNGHTIDAKGQSGIFNVTGDNVVIKDITLQNGNATEGGAIVWNGANGTLENAKLVNNTADNGGAVLWNGDNATIKDSVFKNNTAMTGAGVVLNGNDATVDNSTFTGNNANSGAGIVANGNGTTISDSTFEDNEAVNGAGVVINGNDATIENSTFVNNTAETGAGVVSNGNGTTIADSTFENNTASEGAGAVLNGDDAVVEGSTFTGNEADSGAGVVINGNDATIENSTFANNTAMTGAGVVSNGNGTTIADSEFTGNNANSGAGAVLNGDNATVEGSTFTGNEAVNGAGVVSNGDGTTIADSTFENNTAETGAGAVLNGNDATVENSTFAGNNATTGAGIVTTGNDTTITGSTFANNTAETGAGVVSEGEGTTIADSEFTGNNATTGAGAVLNGNNATVEGSTFTGNDAKDGAGVVSNGNGTTIADTTFENNTAETGAGAVLNGNDATVENSTFAGNNATTGAGIVSNGEGTSIADTTFENNTAVTGAGAVLNGEGASVSNSTFTGNNATSGSAIALGDNATGVDIADDVVMENNTGSELVRNPTIILDVPSLVKVGDDATIVVTVNNAYGNVTLYIDGKEITTKDLADDHTATYVATGLTKGVHEVKAVYNGGSSTKPVVGTSELLRVEVGDEYAPGYKEGELVVKYMSFQDLQKLIDDAVAAGNTTIVLDHDFEFDIGNDTVPVVVPDGVTIDGQGHFVSGADASTIFNVTGDNVVIKNITLTNAKGEEGGAIVWSGDNGTLENAVLANNTADNGGAVLWNGDNATIKDSVFENNTAMTGAGVVLNGNDATVDNSTFTGNNANSGAGIVANGNGTTISDSTFEDNEAVNGAGVVINGNDATIENSTFVNNTAETGAGVVSNGNGTTIADSTFENNTAEEGAGAVLNGDDAVVEGSTFTGNEADSGAGVVINGNNAAVENSTFANNTAMTGAGVVSNGNGTTIADTTFENNTADTGAGALLNGDDATVENSTFTGNEAVNGAGVVSNGKGTTIADSTFANNTADTGAGALLNGDDATVENSEFKDNLASEGAGAVLNGNNATVENSTFKNNHAETGAGVLSNGNGTTIADTTFENNTAETGAGAVLNGNGASVENATFTGNNATTGAGIVANGENTTVSDTTFTNNTAESGSVMVVGENATVDTNNVTAENNTNMDGKSDIMESTDMSISVDGLNVTVDLTAKSGNVTGNITVTVDGKDYTAEVVDGKASITLDPLTYGLHIVNVKYFGDDTHAVAYGIDMMSITPVRTVISIISVDENFLITGVLKDEKGNVLANMEITYTANGENITVVTDSEGKFTAQGADNNKYTFAFNGLYELTASEKSITFNNVAANETTTQITGSDFTQYAMDYYIGERGGNFIIQLKDVNGNPLANKTIKIGYNGVTLVRTTDENGNAIVQINLANAGRYTFAVVFLGDEDYKASMSVYSVYINKKPITISASAKKFKASVKTKKYTVTLKTIRGSSVDGKTYLKAGKKVTLTVNGKTYTAKINAKGKATFKITKLTKKGKYTATIKFAGDNSYKPASKKVKITIR